MNPITAAAGKVMYGALVRANAQITGHMVSLRVTVKLYAFTKILHQHRKSEWPRLIISEVLLKNKQTKHYHMMNILLNDTS